MGKLAIWRERESYFQRKIIPQRKVSLWGKFTQCSLEGKILPQKMFSEDRQKGVKPVRPLLSKIPCRKRGGVQKSMGHKVPWRLGCWYVTLQLRDHAFSHRQKQFYLSVTSRPPRWQLMLWIVFSPFNFATHEMEDPFDPMLGAIVIHHGDSHSLWQRSELAVLLGECGCE